MSEPGAARPSFKKLGARRQAVRVASQDLVREGPFDAGRRSSDGRCLPWLVEPAVSSVDVAAWAGENKDRLRRLLARHGGILFRGFQVPDAAAFAKLTAAMSEELLEYRERSSPRHRVEGNVYTSTDHPADQPIFLHNENSYQNRWPMKIFFYCQKAAEVGGETPIADCRNVYQRIDPEIRRRFTSRRWLYRRRFGDGVGLDWPTVFQTTVPEEVEAYCRDNGIEAEWREGRGLSTRAIRPAVAKHPETGETVWFNHATFFHVSSLPPAVREAVESQFAEEDLPANSYYGDGSPIEPEVLEHLRDAYEQETVRFQWLEGDVLMLDNMLVCHGRAPFRGERRVLAGMAEPCSWDRLPAL